MTQSASFGMYDADQAWARPKPLWANAPAIGIVMSQRAGHVSLRNRRRYTPASTTFGRTYARVLAVNCQLARAYRGRLLKEPGMIDGQMDSMRRPHGWKTEAVVI